MTNVLMRSVEAACISFLGISISPSILAMSEQNETLIITTVCVQGGLLATAVIAILMAVAARIRAKTEKDAADQLRQTNSQKLDNIGAAVGAAPVPPPEKKL